jgi:hypothetical protein
MLHCSDINQPSYKMKIKGAYLSLLIMEYTCKLD